MKRNKPNLACIYFVALGLTCTATKVWSDAPANGEDFFYLGALVPDCEVDAVRERGGKRADTMTGNAADVIREHVAVPISKKGCVERLKELAGYINLIWPSKLYNEAIIDKIKDAACDAIEDMLIKTIEREKLALHSPYGYVGVDLGLKRGGGGITHEDSGTVSEPLESIVLKETKEVINEEGREAAKELEEQTKINDINRDASKIKREGENEFDSSVQDGIDAL